MSRKRLNFGDAFHEQGKVSLLTRQAVRQLQYLIFIMAFFHVFSCVLTFGLGMAKVNILAFIIFWLFGYFVLYVLSFSNRFPPLLFLSWVRWDVNYLWLLHTQIDSWQPEKTEGNSNRNSFPSCFLKSNFFGLMHLHVLCVHNMWMFT